MRANSKDQLLTALPDDRWHPELEIIFSSRDGYVWASWQDCYAVNLGNHEAVAAMMRDFLAQDALAKQLDALGKRQLLARRGDD